MPEKLTKESLRRPSFTPEEFFNSEIAKKKGIRNYPSKEQEQLILSNLRSTSHLMQEVRDLLGVPVFINSAYRCPDLNKLVGSKPTSQHLLGLACDFTCNAFGTPEEVVLFLFEKKILVDQCFNEGTWVHISRKESNNREMFGHYLLDLKTKERKFHKL